MEAAAAAAEDAAGATAVVDGGDRVTRGRGMGLPGATRDWSSLPKPAILLVLMGLRPSLVDAFSFPCVCKEWRSVYIDCRRELLSSMPPLLVNTCNYYYFSPGIFLPQYKKFQGWRGTPLTCVGAAEWGGREDCLYMDCKASATVVVWSMKDGSVEHHPRHFWEWWVPSFCYA